MTRFLDMLKLYIISNILHHITLVPASQSQTETIARLVFPQRQNRLGRHHHMREDAGLDNLSHVFLRCGLFHSKICGRLFFDIFAYIFCIFALSTFVEETLKLYRIIAVILYMFR